jgi:hypothetical protein
MAFALNIVVLLNLVNNCIMHKQKLLAIYLLEVEITIGLSMVKLFIGETQHPRSEDNLDIDLDGDLVSWDAQV